MSKARTHGRLYVTRHLWVPEKPLARLNLKIADAIREHMPALPLQGDAALARFPALRDFPVRVCSRVSGVHTVLFSILDPHSAIPRHRGWATGVVRLHYPLIVPRDWHRCRIHIEDVAYPWRECEPLLFDDTYAHSVDNDTDELRAVLIVDFEPRMSLLLDAFMKLRYVIVRRPEEIRTICDRATVST